MRTISIRRQVDGSPAGRLSLPPTSAAAPGWLTPSRSHVMPAHAICGPAWWLGGWLVTRGTAGRRRAQAGLSSAVRALPQLRHGWHGSSRTGGGAANPEVAALPGEQEEVADPGAGEAGPRPRYRRMQGAASSVQEATRGRAFVQGGHCRANPLGAGGEPRSWAYGWDHPGV